MKVLILGGEGQLGTELQVSLRGSSIACGRNDVDITSRESFLHQLDKTAVDVVINAAAYNLVDQAEDEPDAAYRINALGPRNLALECAVRNLPLVHISSDYVFGQDASDDPWKETDTPGPVSAYGTSKLAGEYFVRSLSEKHFVIRTCGLYGHAARTGTGKGNFVETMLRLGSERDELRVVNDQHCTPTSVKDLATAICDLIQTDSYGLYHCTNVGDCTWAKLAIEIFQYSKLDVCVSPIPSSEYPTKAKRPKQSLLDCTKLTAVIGRAMPHWKDALHQYLDERKIDEQLSDS